MSLKIIFMGTPDFSVPALKALASAGHDIRAVFTQPPRPAGRGKTLRPSPVQNAADALGINIWSPASLKSEEMLDHIRALDADAGVVAAYGLILPQAILNVPKHGCLNIHASLLPRWRGAAPIQRAIEAGDTQTGVTIMQMEAGLDTGPMALKRSTPITDTTTARALHDTLAEIGAALIVEALDSLANAALSFSQQDDQLATYAKKITKDEAALDLKTLTAEKAQRKIHALSPFPGAFVTLNGKRLKILQTARTDAQGEPGKTLDNALTLACKTGALVPTEVQLAGKSPMPRTDFLRGISVPAGTAL